MFLYTHLGLVTITLCQRQIQFLFQSAAIRAMEVYLRCPFQEVTYVTPSDRSTNHPTDRHGGVYGYLKKKYFQKKVKLCFKYMQNFNNLIKEITQPRIKLSPMNFTLLSKVYSRYDKEGRNNESSEFAFSEYNKYTDEGLKRFSIQQLFKSQCLSVCLKRLNRLTRRLKEGLKGLLGLQRLKTFELGSLVCVTLPLNCEALVFAQNVLTFYKIIMISE